MTAQQQPGASAQGWVTAANRIAPARAWTCPECSAVCLHARDVHTPELCARLKAEQHGTSERGAVEELLACKSENHNSGDPADWCDGWPCEQVIPIVESLRTRLADAERANLELKLDRNSAEIERDAAQREAQALREAVEAIAEWDYNHWRGLPVRLARPLVEALASTDRGGQDI